MQGSAGDPHLSNETCWAYEARDNGWGRSGDEGEVLPSLARGHTSGESRSWSEEVYAMATSKTD